MKLLIIITINQFKEDIRNLLSENQVSLITETDVDSFKADYEQTNENNWFGDRHNPINSTKFLAFIKDEKIEFILNQIKEYKNDKRCLNSLQALVLDGIKSV